MYTCVAAPLETERKRLQPLLGVVKERYFVRFDVVHTIDAVRPLFVRAPSGRKPSGAGIVSQGPEKKGRSWRLEQQAIAGGAGRWAHGPSRRTRRPRGRGSAAPAACPWALQEAQTQRESVPVRPRGCLGGEVVSPPACPHTPLHPPLTDGHALGVDGAEVAVLQQVDDKVLGRLLQRQQPLRRPPERLRRDVVRDLADLRGRAEKYTSDVSTRIPGAHTPL